MRRFAAGTCAVILSYMFLSAGAAAAQTIDAGPVEIGFGGRAQIQFNTTSVDEDDLGVFAAVAGEIPYSTFLTRRIRLTVEVEIEDWITGVIQPDFTLGELSLKDAWLNFAFDDAFGLRVGQFKKPFSRIELTSTTKYLAIEKGLSIRGLNLAASAAGAGAIGGPENRPFRWIPGEEQRILDGLGYLGRDIGVAAHGAVGRIGYAIGAFNGRGADRLDNAGGKSFAGRVTVAPVQGIPLSFGLGSSYRESAVSVLIPDNDPATTDRQTVSVDGFAFEADAEWGDFRRPGLHLLVEGAAGNNFLGAILHLDWAPVPDLPDPLPIAAGRFPDDAPFLGAQGFLAWFQPLGGGRLEGVEPLARVSVGDPNTDRADDEGWLLTPGVNLYFFGRNRLMFNWDVFISANDALETHHSLRAQVNLHF